MTEFDFLGKYQLSHTDTHTSCTEMISECLFFSNICSTKSQCVWKTYHDGRCGCSILSSTPALSDVGTPGLLTHLKTDRLTVLNVQERTQDDRTFRQ